MKAPGVPPSDQEFIFDPFYRGAAARESQVPGSGLGLSLVKLMVEAMGGHVDVQSELGVGSSFSLRLRVVNRPDQNTIEEMAGTIDT